MLDAHLRGWDALISESTEKFSSYMSRSDVEFAADPSLDAIPVDQRIERLKCDTGAHDPGLVAMYWRFGKYLLVASSAGCATLPANLQGAWADGLKSPWNADYHTNINLQMNYWHAEEANLGDCTKPLFRYMNDFLLPAPPQELSCGSFRGLRARGGLEVSCEWRDGRVVRTEITPDAPCEVTVEYENGERVTVYLSGKTILERYSPDYYSPTSDRSATYTNMEL